MNNKKGMIFDIQRFSVSDGPGIRTTVFFKGCNLKCVWCHNPESQSSASEMLFYKNKCVNCGKCKELCANSLEKCSLCGKCVIECQAEARTIAGKEYTADEVVRELVKDKRLYENSGGGVTFSGGECMLQTDFLTELLKRCKEEGLHTALDTAGHIPFEYFERIMPYTDLFLYDVKCFDAEIHKRYTGVTNELILENLKKLLHLKTPIWVRIPIIPSVNDSIAEMKKIKSLFDLFGQPKKIELLPYHAIGNSKYEAMNKEYPIFSVPSKEKMRELNSVFNTI